MTINKFSKKQAEILKFINESYDTLICDGAIRSGKTITMALAFVIWATEHFDRCNFAICGKTVANAERNVLKPFLQLEGLPYSSKYQLTKRMLTIKCGKKENYFYIFGGKDESSYMLIQGITLAGVLFDEVALMPKSFVDQAISRTASYLNAKIWFNCNPESPGHWFYKDWLEDDKYKDKNAKRLHFLMHDNPIMTKEKIDKTARRFTGLFYDRYVLGQWVVADGLVYQQFNNNISEKLYRGNPDNLYGTWYVSMDYGTINPTSMGLWCISDGKAIRTKEYYFDSRKEGYQRTDEEHYTALRELTKGVYIESVIVDPSAASFINTIKRHGEFRVRQAKNDVLNGIRVTNSLLCNSRVLIGENCKDSIREFGLYTWDDKSTEDKVIKQNDHAMDDIRYFCYTILAREFKFDDWGD